MPHITAPESTIQTSHDSPDEPHPGDTQAWQEKQLLRQLKGGLLLVLGYLLSPLCWWNDLIFNLPIAYGFGSICSLLSPQLFMPCSIAGYWLSNIVGILLLQFGVVDVFQTLPLKSQLKQELWKGMISSTAYTLLILGLIHFKILETPILFTGG